MSYYLKSVKNGVRVCYGSLHCNNFVECYQDASKFYVVAYYTNVTRGNVTKLSRTFKAFGSVRDANTYFAKCRKAVKQSLREC